MFAQKDFHKKLLSLLLALVVLASLPLAAFAEEAVRSYSDVPLGSWFYDSVDYLTALGVMSGVGGGKFDPNGKLTRAMTVAILYRINGCPDVSALDNPFEDVPAESWFEDAVKWAVNSKVTYGTGETSFSPTRSITREELACFVVRYAQSVKPDFATSGLQVACPMEEIREAVIAEGTSPFAVEAMSVMAKTTLYYGGAHEPLYPKRTATRAETASVFAALSVRLGIYPEPVKLISGEDCMDKQFDSETDGGVQTVTNEESVRILRNVFSSTSFELAEPADFAVYYRVYLWGNEYQLAKDKDASEVLKLILPDGTVRYLKPKEGHTMNSVFLGLELALQTQALDAEA